MRAWLATLLIGFQLAACPSAGGDDETAPADDTRVATALCEYLVRCEPMIGRLAGSVEECVNLLFATMNNCGPFSFENEQADIDACVTWLGTDACGWSTLEPRSPFTSGPCGALHGRTEDPVAAAGPGQDCSDTDACIDGYCDRDVPAGTCVVCVAKGDAGAPCSGDWLCQDTLFCDTAASECTAPRADDGDCSTDRQCSSSYCVAGTCGQPLERGDDCSAGGRCRGNLTCIEGSCTDRLGQGETCTLPADCRLGFVCDQNTCKQTAQCGSGAVGDRCSGNNACGAGLYCNDSGEVCAAQLASDAACFGSEGECGPTNICRSSDDTCQPPGESGAECGASSDCLDSLYCDYNQSRCAPLEPNGNECGWDGMCTSGHCNQSVIPQVCADEPACTMP
jgi:hypothetical protein